MASTTYTWTGVNSGDWDTATNWSPSTPNYAAGVTTTKDSLLFNQGASPYTSIFSSTGVDQVYDLTINGTNATVLAGDQGELDVANAIVVNAGTLDLGAGGVLSYLPGATQSFVLNGILQGAGFVNTQDPAITGTGTIIAVNDGAGTEMFLGSALGASPSDTLTVQIQAGAAAQLGAAVASGVTVSVGAGGSVLLDKLPQFQGTISGLAVAFGPNSTVPADTNFVDLTATNPANITGISLHNGTITVSDSADGNGSILLSGSSYAGDFANYTSDGTGGTNLFVDDTVCFVAGTQILTPTGNVPVETLSAGEDVIVVVDGQRIARPVTWVGYRKLALDQAAIVRGLAPVRLRRDAIADGLPARDLLVSPPHCLFIDGKLIPAKLLVNDMTILLDTACASVEYYHIELDRHAVLIAEGVESESYLDTGNRAFFANAGLAMILHPEFHLNAGLRCWATDACAPLAISPTAVQPVWRQLTDRAKRLGFVLPARVTTQDADIHLVADGRRIDTVAVKDRVHSFLIPAAVKSLVLASRSVVPNVLVRYLDDPRQIGVAVQRITIRGIAGRAEFSADHPALACGWHCPEQADGALWCWTKGNAVLPTGVVAGPVVVDVVVWETTTYLIDDMQTESCLVAA